MFTLRSMTLNFIKSIASKAINYFRSKPGIFKAFSLAVFTFFVGLFTGKGSEKKKAEKEKRQYTDAIKKHEAEIRRLKSIEMSDRKKTKLIKKQQKQIDALRAKLEELES